MFKILLIVFALFLPSGCVTNSTPVQQPAQTNLSEKTDTLMRLGDNMFNKGDRDAALSFYMRAHESQPQAQQPIYKIFDLLVQSNKIEDAHNFMQQVTSLNEDDMKLAVTYARFLMNYKRAESLAYLEKASDHFKDIRFYNWYGVALDLNGKHTQAQDAYKKGLHIAPNSSALKNNLALSYAVTYKVEFALALYDELIAENPDKLLYKKNKAITYILYNAFDMAEALLQPEMNMVEIRNLTVKYKNQLDKNTPLGILKLINGL